MQTNNTYGFYDVINKYLKISLNYTENCITVKFKSEEYMTSAYEIGVRSLTEHKNPNQVYKKQVVLLNALVVTLQKGSPDPVSVISDRFLFKILSLYKSVVESIFLIGFAEKAKNILKEKNESDYRNIFINAIKEHVACLKKKYENVLRIPVLNLNASSLTLLSDSDEQIVQMFSRRNSNEKRSLDIIRSDFFEEPQQNPGIKYSLSDQSIKKVQSELTHSNSEIRLSRSSSLKTSKKYKSCPINPLNGNNFNLDLEAINKKKNIAELSIKEFEFCKYIAYKKLTFPEISPKKIKGYQELKKEIEKQSGKIRFNTITTMKLDEPFMIKLLIEEGICRLLKKISASSASFASDIDRHILKIGANYYTEGKIISILSPPINVDSHLCDVKADAFCKLLAFLINKLIEQRDFIKVMNSADNSNSILPSNEHYDEVLQEWKRLVKGRGDEDTFESICIDFLNSMTVQEESFCEKDMESYLIRKQVKLLLWFLNQEMYSIPMLSLLKAMPEGVLAPNPGVIQLNFFRGDQIEVIAKACLIPAKNSGFEGFRIIAQNRVSSYFSKIPAYSSEVSIEVENAENVPIFITNILTSMGFTYTQG